jgi:hypothetical protein
VLDQAALAATRSLPRLCFCTAKRAR